MNNHEYTQRKAMSQALKDFSNGLPSESGKYGARKGSAWDAWYSSEYAFLETLKEGSTCMVSIKGKDKAAVLAALYNNAKPLGFGIVVASKEPMSTEAAQKILDSGQTFFDYLNGRVMKVHLDEDEFNPRLYDRDNGEGAAAKAIAHL